MECQKCQVECQDNPTEGILGHLSFWCPSCGLCQGEREAKTPSESPSQTPSQMLMGHFLNDKVLPPIGEMKFRITIDNLTFDEATKLAQDLVAKWGRVTFSAYHPG